MSDERVMVLKMLRDGKISVEEAEGLLEALGEEGLGASPMPNDEQAKRAEEPDSQTAEGRSTPGDQGAAPGWRRKSGEPLRTGPDWASLGREIGEVVREATQVVREATKDVAPTVRDAVKRLKEEMKGAGGKVSASLLVQDLFGLTSASDEVRVSHLLPAGGRLLLRNPRGNVRIERSPDGQAYVEARRQAWSRDEEAARALLDQIGVRFEPRDGDLVLEVAAEPGFRFRVDLTVRLPDGVAVVAGVNSGDIRAEGLSGDLEVDIKSGDLEIGSHQGAVRGSVKSGEVKLGVAATCALRVMSGDVAAQEIGGNAEFHVASGDVEIGHVRGGLVAEVLRGDLMVGSVAGPARVKVMSGDAALGGCSGDVEAHVYSGDLKLNARGSRSVRAKTMSGDLEARIDSLETGADVAIEAMSGDIDVVLAPGVGARIDARTRSGNVEWSLPGQTVQRSRGGAEGVVGTPDATLSIRAMAGDISVREAK
jgi:hypothetical protein